MKTVMLMAALAALTLVAGSASAWTVEARYPDSTLKATYECNEYGAMDGPYVEYHPSGAVKARGAYANGRRSGTWVECDDSGAVLVSQEYGEVAAPQEPVARDSSPPAPSAHRTGLRVVTSGPDVEVVVGGKSFGTHDTLVVPLSEGRYRITGRKRRCFDDIESEQVEPGAVLTEVSLTPRRVRVEFSPRVGVVLADGQTSGPVLCLTAGLRTVRRSWGALLMTKMPPGAYADNNSYFIIGAHYTFVNVCTPHVVLETGLSGGYCRSARMEADSAYQPGYSPYYPGYSYPMEVKHVSRTGVLGPRLLLHLGGECFKFVLGAEYLLLCDDWLSLESSRNLLALYGGLALGF
jgi:hypothetical protein